MEIVFRLNDDFISCYPELESALRPLQEEYPDTYSRICWALVLDTHPTSIYRNIDTPTRRKFIEDIYTNFPMDWEKHDPIRELFKELFLTKKKRYLVAWEDKLDERQTYMASQPYSSNNFEELDKMMGSTDKMWKQYLSCLKDVEEEDNQAMGGAQESLSEKGEI